MKTATTNSKHAKPSGRLISLARLAVVLVLAAGSIASHANLVAHWTFDESGGSTVHDSAGSFNGTLSPEGAAFVAGGISGNAISLTRASNGFVNMGNVLGLASGDFSIVAWVKMTAGDRTDSSVVLSKQAAGYPNGYVLIVNKSDRHGQTDKAFFYDSGVPGQEAVSTTSVNDGIWHQVVGVYKTGGSMRIYVDGSPAEASQPSLSLVANSASFLIGGINFAGVSTGMFTGLIDDVQVYNHALSDGDIDFLLQHPGQVSISRAAPIAHWTFDESSGSTAHDSAGAFDGALSPSGAAFVSGGISSNAISLSSASNGFVNMGNVLGLTSGDFSIVAWVKMSPGDRTDNSVFIGKHAAGTKNGYFLNVNTTAGALVNDKAAFYEGGTGIAQITIAETPISTTTVNDGNWHQVVAVYQTGGNKSIYVDGAPAEDVRPSQPFDGNSAAFLIGGVNSGGVPAGLFTGLIDEVQIFNTALSDGDVDYLFQHPGQPTSGCVTAPPGLVSWWQAESNALDSADNNLGTSIGNATYGPGRVGQAFSFDGTGDAVFLGNPSNLRLQDLTIEGWVKRSSATQVSSNPLFGEIVGYGPGGYVLGFRQDGSLYLSKNTVSDVQSVGTITNTAWHHIAVTRTGSTVVFYVDGAAEPAITYNATFEFTSDLRIGAVNSTVDSSFLGMIDELSIYNRSLSTTEIQSIYNAGGAGKCRIPDCSEQLAAAQTQLSVSEAVNSALQAQLLTANATNAALQAKLVSTIATNAVLAAQLAAANASIASLQAQLSAANNSNATLQTQLVTCNSALAAANQNVQTLQHEIQDLVLPLQLLTQTFRETFHDPQFEIRGGTTVEQMQNLVVEILDLPNGEQQELFISLGGNKGKKIKEIRQGVRPEQ